MPCRPMVVESGRTIELGEEGNEQSSTALSVRCSFCIGLAERATFASEGEACG
jgi:hypothetical protein